MLFTRALLSAIKDWHHSIGIATMVEHHGASFVKASLLVFWG